uniref:Putative golgin subfamily protein b member panstrongylus megistus n=1 Tax=Rhodnius prolixus TaxID=13249 RepID=A0A4P6DAC0_RHOPR
MRDSKNSQVKFNEVKHALDTEKTKKLVSVLQCTQSELNEVKRALAAEQSKTNQLTRKLKNAELENYETKLVLQDEKLKSNKLIDDLKNSQCYLSEVKEALDVEKSNFKKLINDLGKLQSELNNTKQTLNSEQIKSRNLIDSLENSQGQLNAAKDALLAEQTKSNILIKNLDKSQNELNYTTKALRNEECKSSKLITELENSHLKLNEVNHLLKEKCKIICDLKEESTNLNCETSSLSESNLKLKQENDSLKINIDTLLEQIETTKLKEIQGAKEFIDIKRSNELLTIKLVKLEETNNLLTSKLSSCKMNVDDFRKEISKLKTYCKNLIEDQRSSLRKNHQDIVKSVANFIAIGTASESLLKEDLHDFEIQKEVGFRSTELQENKLSLEIASKNESVGVVECYCLKKKHLVDNECQVNILQNEINETLIQELRKGANSSNKSSISRKDEISKSEVELLSERNTSKIQSLETNLALSKQELLTTQLEINQLRDEFYSYRLRAQALLSKQKGELESQREKEAKEQIEKLNNELENIRGKMEIILTEDESLKYRVATLQSEKEVIDKKYDDISRALHQKIIDYDTLNTEYNAFKLSTDTFIHNNKIVLEEKYKSEITAKDAIINKLKSDLKENDSAKPDDQISEISQFNASVNDTEEILQEREDGEVSIFHLLYKIKAFFVIVYMFF